ncbi:MAG: adenosylcobinamide-GDP ribazoletransferase [Chloroflexi bacterium]|nr:adenosylcobinamide-GDP ribazoletransferase [Chloroflexota bacterium]
MSLLAALQLLTTIPIRRATRPGEIAGAVTYFPLVGFIIGLILAGLSWVLAFLLPDALANALVIVALVVITGAMHLDGLADTCDGLAGHRTVEERWQVMRDSRSGAFGVIGLILVLLVKYISLNSIPPALLTMVLIFMPVASRWAMVYAIFAYPYARPSGLGKTFKEGATLSRFLIATLITVGLLVLLLPVFRLSGLALLFGVWLMTVILASYFRGNFAGLTGDTYGAINEITETGVLVLAILLARFQLI